jgi:acetyl/propionyl-CoA carboxylase alpha subunit
VGAGTVEFIFDLANHCIYFMEMNTRLQVEHPVTEAVSGVDIVSKQFEIASGKSIADIVPGKNGYAMEVRINAEKVKISDIGKIQFVPNPGEITEYIMPEEAGVEIISTIGKGKKVTPYYDSMVVHIICHGNKREDTIEKMISYLGRVVIQGICTNIALIKRILKDETFRGGVYDTGFLPKFLVGIDAKALIKEIEDISGVVEQKLDIKSLRIAESNEIKVVSPSTGIFYLTPNPAEPAFVKVGGRISTKKTMCLLEAMKLFTAVTLESFNSESGEIYPNSQEYEVTRVNKTTGQQVNVGDLLFVIRPLDGLVKDKTIQLQEVKN